MRRNNIRSRPVPKRSRKNEGDIVQQIAIPIIIACVLYMAYATITRRGHSVYVAQAATPGSVQVVVETAKPETQKAVKSASKSVPTPAKPFVAKPVSTDFASLPVKLNRFGARLPLTPGHNLAFETLKNVPGAKVSNATLTFYGIDRKSTGKSPGDRGYGITRMGYDARPCKVTGRCVYAAANLQWLGINPNSDYPKKIWIEGLGFRLVTDTGSAFRGTHDRFDILVRSDTEADKLGRINRRVVILPDNYPFPFTE